MIKKEKNNEQKEFQAAFVKSALEMIILKFLRTQPIHGYGLIVAIQKNFDVPVGASTIYPILEKLEKNNYITSQWNTEQDRPKKMYNITQKGQETLTHAENTFKTFYQKISEIPLMTKEQT
ncbi:MAG: PadR family transcriptional regulator [Nitrososphaerota archaeon]|jgi:DNA-binding PadR family transcriptional regulator|nr:PadR family transcriptional regulator [Nitrososphaerota archaeon]